MEKIINKIKENAQVRLAENRLDKQEILLYLEHRVFKKGEELDIIQDKIHFERETYIVFMDEAPGMNWGHPCRYLLYDTESGELVNEIEAEFPYFLNEKRPRSLELFKTCRTIEGFRRKKPMKIALEPAKLSAWRKFTELPIFAREGTRYAIFYSGSSNCRHVNDMEFLYRTLIDIYGYDPDNIYVCNYDGTLNWNEEIWEPAAPCNYPVDNTPFRMLINEEGNRTGFQNAIADLATRIRSEDCLLIHTNNHGGWSAAQNEGFMSGWGGSYYASDFAVDLATLPEFHTLLAMMEPCHSGAFNNPIILNSPADRTVVQAAVPWDENSAGGWFFDPWAEMWISAMAGVRGDGSALTTSGDDNMDSLISAWEAFDYAQHIDNPVMDESSADLSKNVFLSRCGRSIKLFKEYKEFKEIKEIEKYKDFKEFEKHKELEKQKDFEKFKDQKEIYEQGQFPERLPQQYEMTEMYPKTGVEIERRMQRLETLIERLSPFIESAKRPDLEKSAYKNETVRKKGE